MQSHNLTLEQFHLQYFGHNQRAENLPSGTGVQQHCKIRQNWTPRWPWFIRNLGIPKCWQTLAAFSLWFFALVESSTLLGCWNFSSTSGVRMRRMHVDVAKCHACHAVSKLANYRGISSLSDVRMAGVPLMALRWLWWRAWFPFGAVVAAAWSPRLRGRRGTWRQRSSLYAAGVALGGMGRHFAWQAWHLASTCILRGRRATLALGWLWWRAWFPFGRLRGKRGTWRHQPSLCVAGVALGDIDLHSAWQAWHFATSTVTLCGRRGPWRSIFTLRGRRGMLHYASMYLYVSLCISMYLYVSLCISMYLYVSLCISMYLYVSLCISMYVIYVISMYLYVSLCISMYLYVSLCMCMYVYVCVRMCMYVYVCVCMCMYVYVCVCMCMYVYVCVCMCMYVYVCVCMCMYMYVYVCVCMCMYVYVCVCMCMYVYVRMYVCVCVCVCMYVCT